MGEGGGVTQNGLEKFTDPVSFLRSLGPLGPMATRADRRTWFAPGNRRDNPSGAYVESVLRMKSLDMIFEND